MKLKAWKFIKKTFGESKQGKVNTKIEGNSNINVQGSNNTINVENKEKLNINEEDEETKEKARLFIIDNEKEINYLPLCIIANNVGSHRNHNRKIYSNFNKCNEKTREEILCQAGYQGLKINEKDWINQYLEKLDKLSIQHKLGKIFLYDGAKYFHRAIERYSNESIIDIKTLIFEIPKLNNSLSCYCDSVLYIDRYLEFILRDREDTKDRPELLPQVPPYNMLWHKCNLGSCSEDIICFWTMQAIQSTIVAFHRHDIVKQEDENLIDMTNKVGTLETFEDYYYETLLELYVAFS